MVYKKENVDITNNSIYKTQQRQLYIEQQEPSQKKRAATGFKKMSYCSFNDKFYTLPDSNLIQISKLFNRGKYNCLLTVF